MNKRIRYTDESIGDVKLVADFLPSPEELKLKSENTKVTISLGSESGQFAGEAIVEAVENQLRDNQPPETNATLERLISLGESRENAMRYIASVLLTEISEVLKNNSPFNEERYIKNLRALPKLPYE